MVFGPTMYLCKDYMGRRILGYLMSTKCFLNGTRKLSSSYGFIFAICQLKWWCHFKNKVQQYDRQLLAIDHQWAACLGPNCRQCFQGSEYNRIQLSRFLSQFDTAFVLRNAAGGLLAFVSKNKEKIRNWEMPSIISFNS